MKTIIEVGANRGVDTRNFLSVAENRVFAFEPTLELMVYMNDQFKHFPNYFPMPMAIDIENGWKWFNIAGTEDWGCSSFYQFNPDIIEKWNRPDFHFTNRYRVPTIRLDTFMEIYGVQEIEYLWIDTQGNDFRVLQSLGDKISLVKSGRCECALSFSLYSDVDNTHTSIVPWLQNHGFKVDVVPEKMSGDREGDVHFTRE